jgi:putative ATP-dependent endonuclease of OLD family
MIRGINLQVANYKSVGEPALGFADIYPLNLVIGRNNSGKTALLDLVEFAVSYKELAGTFFRQRHVGCVDPPLVTFDLRLTEEVISQHFDKNTVWTRSKLTSYAFGCQLLENPVTMRISEKPQILPHRYPVEFPDKELRDHAEMAAKKVPSPLAGKRIGRLAADRDIQPEQVGTLEVGANGRGITNLIRAFRNSSSLNWDVVTGGLLPDLNRIFAPDASFTDIDVQTADDVYWEVYLREAGKGRIPLSASGSGLKTVIAVLANLLLLPVQTKHPLADWVFIFEELENNLHPGVLRRLVQYVADKATEEHCHVFISTHSTVAIDWLFKRDDAQILHVTHNGQQTTVKRIENAPSIHDALDDLDVRASDMLQANGVVWVEGVSDRLYLERWIQLHCEEVGKQAPVHGVDYLMAEYGGKCLSHYQFGYEEEEEKEREQCLERLIPALALSRHAFVVMDSDRRKKGQKLREAKVRVEQAAESWITQGREIENYIPAAVLEALAGQGVGQFELVAGKIKKGKNKKDFALGLAPLIDSTNWRTLDLQERISGLVKRIESWNRAADTKPSQAKTD